jgi:NAD(P)-dependent dehydrogenase (short-subunit alcohol dehydrogenase family)
MPDVVVISGGTAGVGRAVARRFARQGAKLAILARGRDELRSAAVEVVTLGASAALGIPCDVNDDKQVDVATQRIERELGPIDVWIDVAADKPQTSWSPLAIAAGVVGGAIALRVLARALR